MLNQTQLLEWKNEHKDVYKTIIGDTAFYWRPLKRKEYREMTAQTRAIDNLDDAQWVAEEICIDQTVLYPENVMELIENRAGISQLLYDEIMLGSGFAKPTTISV